MGTKISVLAQPLCGRGNPIIVYALPFRVDVLPKTSCAEQIAVPKSIAEDGDGAGATGLPRGEKCAENRLHAESDEKNSAEIMCV